MTRTHINEKHRFFRILDFIVTFLNIEKARKSPLKSLKYMLMAKKSILALLAITIMLNGLFLQAVYAKPDISAESAILIDGKTGRVLWSKNPDVQKPIASVSKVMTAIVVIENASLDEVVTADLAAEKTSESEIYLRKNEKMKVKDLLYALLLQSANDAAVALAKHISDSIPDFADEMNKKAKLLKMNDTQFYNPHGLGDTNISSASDLAKLGRYALQNSDFAKIVRTKSAIISGHKKRKIYNRNKLLWRYKYSMGIKTGFTKGAGSCLLSAAKKGDKYLIATSLKSEDHEKTFSEAEDVFSYGFSRFKYFQIVKKGKLVAKLDVPYSFKKMKVAANKDFGVLSSKESNLSTKIDLSDNITLPINKGDTLGHIRVFEGKELLAKEPLKAQSSREDIGFLSKILFWLEYLFEKIVPST